MSLTLATGALARANAAFDAADAAALKVLKATFPAGSLVAWEHGDHTREAEVVDVCGFRYYHARVRVRSLITSKVYEIGYHGLRIVRGAVS